MWRNNFFKRNQYVIIYGSILSNFSECLKYSINKNYNKILLVIVKQTVGIWEFLP